jgi:hypothetical protein
MRIEDQQGVQPARSEPEFLKWTAKMPIKYEMQIDAATGRRRK